MIERFTEAARRVLVLARDEAYALKHDNVGAEHILLGLLRGEGIAAQALESLGITAVRVRAQLVEIVGSEKQVACDQIPFAPGAKLVLELALGEARSFNREQIGTEHILLGLASETEGVAGRILLDCDSDPWKVRNEVFRMLAAPGCHAQRLGAQSRAGTLVLTRGAGQSVMIGDEIEISVLDQLGERLKIGVDAPLSLRVVNPEGSGVVKHPGASRSSYEIDLLPQRKVGPTVGIRIGDEITVSVMPVVNEKVRLGIQSRALAVVRREIYDESQQEGENHPEA